MAWTKFHVLKMQRAMVHQKKTTAKLSSFCINDSTSRAGYAKSTEFQCVVHLAKRTPPMDLIEYVSELVESSNPIDLDRIEWYDIEWNDGYDLFFVGTARSLSELDHIDEAIRASYPFKPNDEVMVKPVPMTHFPQTR